jgi:hypothetical protein
MASPVLAAVSAAELVSSVVGMTRSLRHHLPPKLAGVAPPAENGTLNALVLGTAQSPPVWLMAVQGWATYQVARANDPAAQNVLRGIGAGMTVGHLVATDSPLWKGRRSPMSLPLYVIGLAGAVGMVVLARPEAARVRDEALRGWPDSTAGDRI